MISSLLHLTAATQKEPTPNPCALSIIVCMQAPMLCGLVSDFSLSQTRTTTSDFSRLVQLQKAMFCAYSVISALFDSRSALWRLMNSAFATPLRTVNLHGWLFVPEGAQVP